MNTKNNILLKEFLSRLNMKQNTGTNNLPPISIVMPSFNQGQYLERTLLSVLNQNYPNFEYIVIDGGSCDNSIEIIKKYASHLTYWVSEPDQGQSDAIQKGFKKANGEIIAWINSDDIYWPGALLIIGEYFKKQQDVDVIYGDSYIIDKNDTILREKRSVAFSKWGFLTGAFDLHQASIFWRKSLYDRVPGLDRSLHLALDPDLWLQFFQNGAIFRHIPRHLSCYRHHDATKSYTQKLIFRKEYETVMLHRMNINVHSKTFKMWRKIMRIRTLFLHTLSGNLKYLLQSAGRRYY